MGKRTKMPTPSSKRCCSENSPSADSPLERGTRPSETQSNSSPMEWLGPLKKISGWRNWYLIFRHAVCVTTWSSPGFWSGQRRNPMHQAVLEGTTQTPNGHCEEHHLPPSPWRKEAWQLAAMTNCSEIWTVQTKGRNWWGAKAGNWEKCISVWMINYLRKS